jgi:hypothetical protein
VNFMRDEMANMVWDVESTVPSQTGQGVSGYETTAQTSVPPPTLEDENVQHSLLGQRRFLATGFRSFPTDLHLLDLPGANHIGRDARGRERRAVN